MATRNKHQQERPSLPRVSKVFQALPASDLAIEQHLSRNKDCTKHYEDKQISIFAKGRTHFHLSALEAMFIKIL